MAEDKLILALIIFAILISFVSVIVTLSMINSNLVPDEPKINYNRIIENPVDSGKGQIKFSIGNP